MGGVAAHRVADKDPAETAWSGTILSKERQKKVKGVLVKGFRQTFTVESPLRYNYDMRWLVDHVTRKLAGFYRNNLKRGIRADGFGRLPLVKDKTLRKDIREGRSGNWVGNRTGWMADHWWVGRIRGSGLKATRLIKPNGSRGGEIPKRNKHSKVGRGNLINKLLARGIDFQSVRGSARKVIRDAIAEALPLMVGQRIGVFSGVDLSAGTIDQKGVP